MTKPTDHEQSFRQGYDQGFADGTATRARTLSTPLPAITGLGKQTGEAVLGEATFVSIDEANGTVRLRAPRHGRDHVIHLDALTLDAFLAWLTTIRATLLADERTQN